MPKLAAALMVRFSKRHYAPLFERGICGSLYDRKRSLTKLCLSSSGFTLPELLIAGIIAAGIAALTGQVMIGQLLEERRLELAARIRENTSRFNYLVQIEASEASEVFVGELQVQGCGNSDDGNSFTFIIPDTVGPYGPLGQASEVKYYNLFGDIRRCGPPVSRNGVLTPAVANVDGVVIRNASIALNPPGCPVSDTRRISYLVQFPQGNLGDLGGCTTAHARSVFICNPPDAANPQVGDCPPLPGP